MQQQNLTDHIGELCSQWSTKMHQIGPTVSLISLADEDLTQPPQECVYMNLHHKQSQCLNVIVP